MYTIEERSKLLAEFFERRKKLLAEERAAAVRNKPPTRTQLRSLMMTYLKHTGKYRHNQLNKKTFEEIQALYIKEQERDADFVPIGSERDEKMIDKMNKKAAGMDEEEVPEETESTKVKFKQEGPSLKIVPDEEEEIDYEVLGMRYPIVNWESAFYHTDRYGVPHDYYRVFRANGSSRYIKTFTEMVSRFDRLDFIELHKRRYPLIRKTLERIMELRLTAESEDIKNWLVQKQTAFGKDFSNPFIADSLLKTIWFSTHHASHAPCYSNEALAIPDAQMAQLVLWIEDNVKTGFNVSRKKIDNPNITMEEYIRIEEEKARRHGKVYTWETATYDRIWDDDDVHNLRSVETEFPAIVFDDTLTSDAALSCEPTVSPLNENEIDFRISFDESGDEDYTSDKDNDDDEIQSSGDMAPLPPRDQRHPWLRYQFEGYTEDIVHNFEQRLETIFGRLVNQVHVLDFARLTEEMRQTLTGRLNICVRLGDTWAWVAPRPERQPVASARALEDAEGAHNEVEGDQTVLAPIHASQPPLAAPARTIA
ncbi:hypothetical protein Tco_1320246 [Tanacetum coccineum]